MCVCLFAVRERVVDYGRWLSFPVCWPAHTRHLCDLTRVSSGASDWRSTSQRPRREWSIFVACRRSLNSARKIPRFPFDAAWSSERRPIRGRSLDRVESGIRQSTEAYAFDWGTGYGSALLSSLRSPVPNTSAERKRTRTSKAFQSSRLQRHWIRPPATTTLPDAPLQRTPFRAALDGSIVVPTERWRA